MYVLWSLCRDADTSDYTEHEQTLCIPDCSKITYNLELVQLQVEIVLSVLVGFPVQFFPASKFVKTEILSLTSDIVRKCTHTCGFSVFTL